MRDDFVSYAYGMDDAFPNIEKELAMEIIFPAGASCFRNVLSGNVRGNDGDIYPLEIISIIGVSQKCIGVILLPVDNYVHLLHCADSDSPHPYMVLRKDFLLYLLYFGRLAKTMHCIV